MYLVWIFLFAFFASWACGVKSGIMLLTQESWRVKIALEVLVIVLFIIAGLMLSIGV